MKKRMPSSTKKFIRRQKAKIRRQIWDVKKQEEAIKKVYINIEKNHEDK